jgi:hypothetical protein
MPSELREVDAPVPLVDKPVRESAVAPAVALSPDSEVAALVEASPTSSSESATSFAARPVDERDCLSDWRLVMASLALPETLTDNPSNIVYPWSGEGVAPGLGDIAKVLRPVMVLIFPLLLTNVLFCMSG